jgi:hypothetical protein
MMLGTCDGQVSNRQTASRQIAGWQLLLVNQTVQSLFVIV